MLTWPSSVRVFVYTEPTDMRRSFDRLSNMVKELLQEDPFSGHLFVFVNRRADRVKILFWDRSGFCLFYKRLERGVFRLPRGEEATREVDVVRLMLILQGLDLSGAKQHKRYKKTAY